MRRWIAAVIVALSLGVVFLFPSFSVGQEQSGGGRKILTRVAAVYPEIAHRMQLRGVVKVEATVAPNGRVKATHVVGGSPLLARSAVEAIEKWTWAEAPQETKELVELKFQPQ